MCRHVIVKTKEKEVLCTNYGELRKELNGAVICDPDLDDEDCLCCVDGEATAALNFMRYEFDGVDDWLLELGVEILA